MGDTNANSNTDELRAIMSSNNSIIDDCKDESGKSLLNAKNNNSISLLNIS